MIESENVEKIVQILNGIDYNVSVTYNGKNNEQLHFFKGVEYNTYSLNSIFFNNQKAIINKSYLELYKQIDQINYYINNKNKIDDSIFKSLWDSIVAIGSKLRDVRQSLDGFDVILYKIERTENFFKHHINKNLLNFEEIDLIKKKFNFHDEINYVDSLSTLFDKLKYEITRSPYKNLDFIGEMISEIKNMPSPDHINYEKFKDDIIKIDKIYSSCYELLNIKSNKYTSAENYLSLIYPETHEASNTSSLIPHFLKYESKIHIVNENLNNKEIIVFNDGSILSKKQNDEYFYPYSHREAHVILKEPLIYEIENKTKKNPNLRKAFINKLENNNYHGFESALVIIDNILNNSEILKNSNYNVLKKLSDLTFEQFDDEINSIIRDAKVKQYGHSISSAKYRHLYDEKTYLLFRDLYDLNVPNNELQTNIGSKISAFKTSKEFNDALSLYLNSLNGFNMDSIVSRMKNVDIEPIIANENLVVCKIDNFKQSSVLGSASWCISRSDTYFKSYCTNGNKQYFIFDLTKPSSDNESNIGITLNKNDEYITAHLKDDKKAYESDLIIAHINRIKLAETLEKNILIKNPIFENKLNF